MKTLKFKISKRGKDCVLRLPNALYDALYKRFSPRYITAEEGYCLLCSETLASCCDCRFRRAVGETCVSVRQIEAAMEARAEVRFCREQKEPPSSADIKTLAKFRRAMRRAVERGAR